VLLFAAAIFPKTAGATASAELYRLDTQLYGRYEARIRFAPGSGVVGSFFLWKPGSDAPGAFWNELDFEALGIDCHLQTNSIYGQPKANHEQVSAIPGGICALYHDYRFEWTPTYIAWAVDGQEIRRDTGAAATAYSQNATGGLAFHFNIWPGDASFGGNFNPAILPVSYYISWVQYSSYVSNGTFQVAWREEFDGAALPASWAAGNWASPKNLSIHNARNIGFVNGIAILSMTTDTALGPSVTPPADVTVDAGAIVDASARDARADTGTRDATNGVDAATSGTTGGASGNAAGGAAPDAASSGSGGNATGGAGTSGAGTSSTTTTGAGGAAGNVMSSSTGGAPKGDGSVLPRGETSNDSGCSCRVARREGGGPSAFGTGILGLLLARRRRKRTRDK
jgi:endo-1,3-1,4-beta-glycanase ExoK